VEEVAGLALLAHTLIPYLHQQLMMGVGVEGVGEEGVQHLPLCACLLNSLLLVLLAGERSLKHRYCAQQRS
jgi:hypothetical protein